MRPSASLLTTFIVLVGTCLAIRSYVQLKRSIPDPARSIRAALKAVRGCDCEIEREGLPGPTDRNEEYRILSMLLKEESESTKTIGSIVIGEEHNTEHHHEKGTDPACRETEAWADLSRKDQQYSPLEKRFGLGIPMVLLSRDEINEIFRDQDGWKRFYKRFPDSDGIWYLSRVGFSRRGHIAIVRIENHIRHGDLRGTTYLLVRTRDGWQAYRYTICIS